MVGLAIADLFDTPVLPGFSAADDVLSAAEEQALIARIDATDLHPFQFQRWIGKRLTHGFGWKYDYQSGALSRGEPIPDWLLSVRERAAAFARIAEDEIVQAMLLRYDPGAGIGWHKNRPIYEHVLGISLGTPATMRFRRRADRGWDRASAPLMPRALYHLSGEVRHDWEHSIAEMVAGPRYSITMRSFSAKGRALATRSWAGSMDAVIAAGKQADGRTVRPRAQYG